MLEPSRRHLSQRSTKRAGMRSSQSRRHLLLEQDVWYLCSAHFYCPAQRTALSRTIHSVVTTSMNFHAGTLNEWKVQLVKCSVFIRVTSPETVHVDMSIPWPVAFTQAALAIFLLVCSLLQNCKAATVASTTLVLKHSNCNCVAAGACIPDDPGFTSRTASCVDYISNCTFSPLIQTISPARCDYLSCFTLPEDSRFCMWCWQTPAHD